MSKRRAWHKSTFGMETLNIGPFYIVARADSFTVALFRPSHEDGFKPKEQLALGVRAAKKQALQEAKAVLQGWIDELDRLMSEDG